MNNKNKMIDQIKAYIQDDKLELAIRLSRTLIKNSDQYLKEFEELELIFNQVNRLIKDGYTREEYTRVVDSLNITINSINNIHFNLTNIYADDTLKNNTARFFGYSGVLFGREKEFKLLNKIWGNDKFNLLQIVAWGGTGKTALVKNWIQSLPKIKDYHIYVWSFDSQGPREEKQSNSDLFFNDALEFFGETNKLELPKDQYAKADLLARLIRKRKTLLILDGIESLQYPPSPSESVAKSRLKDMPLSIFLKELSNENNGLCIITSRIMIEDLPGETEKSKLIKLESLSSVAGQELLKHLNVKGTKQDLQSAVSEFKGHPLALRLLGGYISIFKDGDIKKRKEIGGLIENEDAIGGAKRVMEAYWRWFKEEEPDPGKADSPRLLILYLMGLFDKPVKIDILSKLWRLNKIFLFSDNLNKNTKFIKAYIQLSELGLLTLFKNEDYIGREEIFGNVEYLDAHPLVREFFGEKFKIENVNYWKKAHKILFDHYKELGHKKLVLEIEDMEPLFNAIAHACKINLHHKAYDIYWKSILWEDNYYCSRVLGAFGAELSTLSSFFDMLWTKPSKKLDENRQVIVLERASECLRAVGRIKDALYPIEEAYRRSITLDNKYRFASILSQLYLIKGDINQSKLYGEQIYVLAKDETKELSREVEDYLALYVNTLYQEGDKNGAYNLYKRVKLSRRKRENNADFDIIMEYYFLDLLLNLGQDKDVYKWLVNKKILKRNTKKEMQNQKQFYVEIPLEHALIDLALAKVNIYWYQQPVNLNENEFIRIIRKGQFRLIKAIEKLKIAQDQTFLPAGFLTQAKLFRLLNDTKNAKLELAKVFEIVNYQHMKLYLIDYYIESSYVFITENNNKGAIDCYHKAEKLVRETGNYRRKLDLDAIKKIFSDKKWA